MKVSGVAKKTVGVRILKEIFWKELQASKTFKSFSKCLKALQAFNKSFQELSQSFYNFKKLLLKSL
jgi:hypothetical protein